MPVAAPAADEVLGVLDAVVDAVAAALDGLRDWGLAGTVEGQYRHDLVADAAALAVLDDAGYGVVSEESGTHRPGAGVVVVVDPVDGSTNASHHLPWWATSTCALDAAGPLAAVVANQATGTRYRAARGAGATRDGSPLRTPAGPATLDRSIVALSGFPGAHWGWEQYRALGAAALDLCAVAAGELDGFVDCAPRSLAPWDYLGGLLVCREAGAVVAEAWGRDLEVREFGPRRTVVAAAGPELLDELLAARRSMGDGPTP